MSPALRVPSAAALRNRGVPVPVHRLVADLAGVPKRPAERSYDDDEAAFDEAWVRFDNNVLSDIEDPDWGWGGLDEWQDALTSTPYATIRRTLALCWGIDSRDRDALRQVGAQMIDDVDLYSTALGAAFLLANGGTPESAGKAIMQGVLASASMREQVAKAIEESLVEEETSPLSPPDGETTETTPTDPADPADTPGSSGLKDGAPSAGTLTSSGV